MHVTASTWNTDFNGGSWSIPGAGSLGQGYPIQFQGDSRLSQRDCDKQSNQGEGFLTPTAQAESCPASDWEVRPTLDSVNSRPS